MTPGLARSFRRDPFIAVDVDDADRFEALSMNDRSSGFGQILFDFGEGSIV